MSFLTTSAGRRFGPGLEGSKGGGGKGRGRRGGREIGTREEGVEEHQESKQEEEVPTITMEDQTVETKPKDSEMEEAMEGTPRNTLTW